MPINTSLIDTPWWMREKNTMNGLVDGMRAGLEIRRLNQQQSQEAARLALAAKGQEMQAQQSNRSFDLQSKQFDVYSQAMQRKADLQALELEDASTLNTGMNALAKGEIPELTFKTIGGRQQWETMKQNSDIAQAERAINKALTEDYTYVAKWNPMGAALLRRFKMGSPEWTWHLEGVMGPAREKELEFKTTAIRQAAEAKAAGELSATQQMGSGIQEHKDAQGNVDFYYTRARNGSFHQIKANDPAAPLIKMYSDDARNKRSTAARLQDPAEQKKMMDAADAAEAKRDELLSKQPKIAPPPAAAGQGAIIEWDQFLKSLETNQPTQP